MPARLARPVSETARLPKYVFHESFASPTSSQLYSESPLVAYDSSVATHMPDEVTREYARRMHYAAFRLANADSPSESLQWRKVYYQLRDQILLGNTKLIYEVIRRRFPNPSQAEDWASDCRVVFIQVVMGYNPWLQIRFSTYAYTCLIRALTRLTKRHYQDRLSTAYPLEALSEQSLGMRSNEDPNSDSDGRLHEFFREDHPLLTSREKYILRRRFSLNGGEKASTLEEVATEVGLSKERVRQVQEIALGKLRQQLQQAKNR